MIIGEILKTHGFNDPFQQKNVFVGKGTKGANQLLFPGIIFGKRKGKGRRTKKKNKYSKVHPRKDTEGTATDPRTQNPKPLGKWK